MNAPGLSTQSAVMRGQRRIYSRREATIRFLLNNGLLVALIVEIVIFSVASPTIFFSRDNFIAILRASAATGITVAFFTMALIAGQIDLSTAQVGALTTVIFAWMFGIQDWPLGIAFIAALVVSVLVGLLMSWLVNRIGLPSLISSLAVGSLCYGLTLAIVQANTTTGLIKLTKPPLRSIVSAEFLGVPVIVILMFCVYFFVYILLNHTKFGAHLYALGGNGQAARLNGIRSTRLIQLVFVGTAVSAGVAAIIVAGRNLSAGSASPVGASGLVLGGPLVATVFAGVGLNGGTGKVERTLFGVLFLVVLSVGMSVLQATPFVRITAEGVCFVLAILLDSIRQHLETR